MRSIIHTLVRDRENIGPWFNECVSSVPAGVAHRVIDCGDNFRVGRWLGLNCESEFVGALDDDDRMVGNPVELCEQALDATGAGIAFTYQAEIGTDGHRLSGVHHGPINTHDVAMHPRCLHHFALIRQSCISQDLLRESYHFHPGSIDWLTKAWVALNHGAVQVPVIGYEWRRHASAMSNSEEAAFNRNVHNIRHIIGSWSKSHKAIPQWTAQQTSQ